MRKTVDNPIVLLSGSPPAGPGPVFDFNDRILSLLTVRIEPSADATFVFNSALFALLELSVNGTFTAPYDLVQVGGIVLDVVGVAQPGTPGSIALSANSLALIGAPSPYPLIGSPIPLLRANVNTPLLTGSVTI